MTGDDFGTLMEQLNKVMDQQTVQLGAMQNAVDEQNEQLKNFVPKRRAGWIVAGVVLAIAALIGVYVYFRVQDRHRDEKRRDETFLAQEADRQSSIRGCQRNNEFRATFREVIEEAYAPQPIPDGVPAELLALVRQGQERQAAKRAELLAKPGVQHVDCEAQFPPLLRQKA